MFNCHRVRIAVGMIDQLHLEAIHCFGIQVDLEDKSRYCTSLYFAVARVVQMGFKNKFSTSWQLPHGKAFPRQRGSRHVRKSDLKTESIVKDKGEVSGDISFIYKGQTVRYYRQRKSDICLSTLNHHYKTRFIN